LSAETDCKQKQAVKRRSWCAIRAPKSSLLAADTCAIEAGYDFDIGRTLGSPLMIRVPNKDQRSGDYSQVPCLCNIENHISRWRSDV